jgi:ribosomal small subunit protein bTHX
MGRGDKKSKKGKRSKGSYGVTRSRNSIKGKIKRAASKKSTTTAPAAEAPVKAKRTVKKKTEA